MQGLHSIENSLKHWVMIIRPQEVGHPAQTGEFDKSPLLDVEGYEWMSKPLQRVKKLRAGHPRLRLILTEEFGNVYRAAFKHLGLANLGLTLYALRHAGASYDLLTGRRDYQGVNDCGGWKTDSSMSRYAKAACAQQLAGRCLTMW